MGNAGCLRIPFLNIQSFFSMEFFLEKKLSSLQINSCYGEGKVSVFGTNITLEVIILYIYRPQPMEHAKSLILHQQIFAP
jgi:hypothetical protein